MLVVVVGVGWPGAELNGGACKCCQKKMQFFRLFLTTNHALMANHLLGDLCATCRFQPSRPPALALQSVQTQAMSCERAARIFGGREERAWAGVVAVKRAKEASRFRV